jgi:hypothetical protein
MVTHTLIFSFLEEMSEMDRAQFFSEASAVILGSGLAESYQQRRHIPLPGDANSPVFVASAMAQVRCADLDAIQKLFTHPPLGEFVQRWQAKFPYQVVWVNTED